ncbi:MAG: nucleotidyltransferase family protein [Deltaproteobacteria bacterium]|jgi:GTP:adenosylcobinamide-phosphate guanylyltransferase|nr:nucleotidyltransferase family protein [Deltaproteobacteria bacterium]
MNGFNSLVLAGRRDSENPFAQLQGDTHRALLDVVGVPMLLRVVRSLRASKSVDRIQVSIDDPDAFEAVAELRELEARGELSCHASLPSPSRSVRDALTDGWLGDRVFVTTADHALLTPEIVDHFAACADASDADLVVGVVAESALRAAYPATTRTYLRFRDGGYSGANLFAFRSQRALRAAEFWVKAESFRKQPWKLARAFGPTTLLLFALRRLSLDEALERASRAIGCRIRAVSLPYAEAAIDVDRPSDLDLVSQILSARGETAG